MPQNIDTLIVRADAHQGTGAGHVMRCLVLALAWKRQGGSVVFCSHIESQALKSRIIADGFEIIKPGAGVDATIQLLRERCLKANWIVLDGYHFGPEWQEILASAGYSVLCVDDGALMPRYSAKVVLAPDPAARPAKYPVRSDTVILAGPRYRLLHSRLTAYPRPIRRDGAGFVVLVTFGGADTGNATCSVLLALDGALSRADTVIVVLGPLNQHRMSIEQTLSEVSYRHELLHDVKDMAPVFERANLAVTAVGGTAWEMAAAGLPAILIPVARNQETGAEYLDREGAAINLKGQHALQDGELASTVKKLMQSPERLAAMSSAGPKVCDGKGPERVCAIVNAISGKSASRELDLRRASVEDMEHVFRLANDPVVRNYSFSPAPISLEDHATWYANRLASLDTIFYVLDLEGVIAALVRYDRNGNEAEIDVAVHPAFRGKGLCSRVLIETAEAAIESLSVARLKAVVFEENTASRRCFMKAGFSETGQILVKGTVCVTYGLVMQSRGIH